MATGRLFRVHAGVFAVSHIAPSLQRDWLAEVLRCGSGAALGFRPAAGLHAIRFGDVRPIDVISPIARDNALQLAGDLVLRYAKPDLTRHHRRTAAQIARALRERGGYDIPWV